MPELVILAVLALTGQVVTVFMVLRYLRERDQRADAQAAAFLAAVERERDAKRDELQQLCQRIQAPDVAVVSYQQSNVPEANSYPLSEEESAMAQDERMQAIAEFERLEREVGAVT